MPRAFPFETPITSDGLIDRQAELHQLHLAATDGAHVRVAGPRRYGNDDGRAWNITGVTVYESVASATLTSPRE